MRPLHLVPALGLVLGLAAAARADQIETLAGDFEEEVLSIAREGPGLVLSTAKRRIACQDVQEVRFAAAARESRPAPARVFLANGDELAGAVAGGDDTKLVVRTGSLGPVEVKLELVRDVVFSADERDVRSFRHEVARREAKSDVAITVALSRTEGVLERIDERGVTIDAKGIGKITLAPDKVLGVRVAALGKAAAAPAGLRARLELADGSLVSGRLEALAEGVFRLEAFRPLEVRAAEVRSLSFSGGRLVYVSDLAPIETKEGPANSVLARPFRKDQNALEAPLKLDGRVYRRGIGAKAASRLVYDIAGGGYGRFRARIGLDDWVREQPPVPWALVKFQVLVDGKPARLTVDGKPFEEDGLLFAQGDPSRAIEVDVTGAKTLGLVLGFGKSEDILPFGDWANAVLVKN
jgi:hypothetical protein